MRVTCFQARSMELYPFLFLVSTLSMTDARINYANILFFYDNSILCNLCTVFTSVPSRVHNTENCRFCFVTRGEDNKAFSRAITDLIPSCEGESTSFPRVRSIDRHTHVCLRREQRVCTAFFHGERRRGDGSNNKLLPE